MPQALPLLTTNLIALKLSTWRPSALRLSKPVLLNEVSVALTWPRCPPCRLKKATPSLVLTHWLPITKSCAALDTNATRAQLQGWQSGMTANTDIMILGCDVAKGDKGQSFVQKLADLTRVDIWWCLTAPSCAAGTNQHQRHQSSATNRRARQ